MMRREGKRFRLPENLLRQSMSADDTSGPPWGLIVGIAIAKLVTIAIILIASWNAETGLFVAVNLWHWFVVGAALIVAPVGMIIRRRRIRARRAALIQAEWMLEPPGSTAATGSGVR